jgi:hypothetical protein
MQLNPELEHPELEQIVSLAKSSIEYFDALRPVVKSKFKIDLFDLVYFTKDPNPDLVNSYTGFDDEWVFSEDSCSEISFSSSDNNNLSDHPISSCRNDVTMHHGTHRCSRSCKGATFICGCTYLNSSGSWTKCGFISYSGEHRHPCCGSPDHYFRSAESSSHTDSIPKRGKSPSGEHHHCSFSHSYYKDGSDYSNNDPYINRYYLEWDKYDYDF